MISKPAATRIGVVKGTTAGTIAESQSLLRARLKAVLLILTLALTLFLVRELLLDVFSWGRLYSTEHGHRVLFALILAFGTGLLFTSRPLSIVQLRAIEISAFLLIMLAIAAGQYSAVLEEIQSGRGPLGLMAVLRGVMFVSFLLMVIYGLLIPNDWRGAARVVVPLTLAPVIVNLTVIARHPEAYDTFIQMATFEQTSVSIILAFLGATTVIYGSHVINTLRHEAYEARRFGQYLLSEKIGDGGMGEVWKAEHNMLARPAAIKLIRPERLKSDTGSAVTALARFEREAQATACLRSPRTIDIHDYGMTDDGTFYYVMELLDGLDLSTLVERFGPVPPERAAYLLQQVCDSLAEAHFNGLVHRDVKPANIYACRLGLEFDFIKVLDFGLVKESAGQEGTRLTAAGIVTGTPAFFAPELAEDAGGADSRSDLYSFGCVAYWLLTGGLVFENDKPLAMILDHIRKDPVPPSQKVEWTIPGPLENAVMSCLEKKPENRPQSAEEVKAAISGARFQPDWDQERARAWWTSHHPASD